MLSDTTGNNGLYPPGLNTSGYNVLSFSKCWCSHIPQGKQMVLSPRFHCSQMFRVTMTSMPQVTVLLDLPGDNTLRCPWQEWFSSPGNNVSMLQCSQITGVTRLLDATKKKKWSWAPSNNDTSGSNYFAPQVTTVLIFQVTAVWDPWGNNVLICPIQPRFGSIRLQSRQTCQVTMLSNATRKQWAWSPGLHCSDITHVTMRRCPR